MYFSSQLNLIPPSAFIIELILFYTSHLFNPFSRLAHIHTYSWEDLYTLVLCPSHFSLNLHLYSFRQFILKNLYLQHFLSFFFFFFWRVSFLRTQIQSLSHCCQVYIYIYLHKHKKFLYSITLSGIQKNIYREIDTVDHA